MTGGSRPSWWSPLAASALLFHAAGVNAWWLLPASVFAALGWSLRRATAKLDR